MRGWQDRAWVRPDEVGVMAGFPAGVSLRVAAVVGCLGDVWRCLCQMFDSFQGMMREG